MFSHHKTIPLRLKFDRAGLDHERVLTERTQNAAKHTKRSCNSRSILYLYIRDDHDDVISGEKAFEKKYTCLNFANTRLLVHASADVNNDQPRWGQRLAIRVEVVQCKLKFARTMQMVDVCGSNMVCMKRSRGGEHSRAAVVNASTRDSGRARHSSHSHAKFSHEYI